MPRVDIGQMNQETWFCRIDSRARAGALCGPKRPHAKEEGDSVETVLKRDGDGLLLYGFRVSRLSASTDSYIVALCLFFFIRSFCSRARRCLSPGGDPALPEIPCLWLPTPPRPCCLLIGLTYRFELRVCASRRRRGRKSVSRDRPVRTQEEHIRMNTDRLRPTKPTTHRFVAEAIFDLI